MLKYKWTNINIESPIDFMEMQALFNKIKPQYCAFDTETTGLHIIADKPFLFQFGFVHPTEYKGWTYIVDLEKQPLFGINVINSWHKLAKCCKYYAGCNTKFDLHMLQNIGIEYTENNLTDVQFWIRYGHDALHIHEGGPPLGLKEYTSRYIDGSAKHNEHLVAQERKNMAKQYNTQLKNRLGVTLKVIKDLFSDCIFEIDDLPDKYKQTYLEWKSELPLHTQKTMGALVTHEDITYNTVNRATLVKYAHFDIVYTLEILTKLIPVVNARKNFGAVDLENKLIIPLVEMESVGFTVRKDYLIECKKKVKNQIVTNRKLLKNLTNTDFGLGQHQVIKQIMHDVFNIDIATTNNDELSKLKSTLKREQENEPAQQFISLLQESRTLEKWYSAYIIRFLNDLKFTDKLYTTINQVGTVSGRVTSDFQQFPRNSITDHDGNELFNPRAMIQSKHAIVYLDYSQIELRFQALYTILVGNPDKNLCRAYMPWLCHLQDGTKFDYNNPQHIKNAYSGQWIDDETNKPWIATDVHGATTTAATGLTPADPGFHDARYAIGKRTNFAKNYGAQLGKIKEMFPDKSEEECIKINDAYYTAFPGIKNYHNYCYNRAQQCAWTGNLFDVKYYNVSGHKLINMLIQGSAAFYLKNKIIELYKFSKENNIKTKWQMQIHDELSWEWDPSDPPELFFKFKYIMENWSDGVVPIIADMEVTTATWADKIEVETLAELKEVLCENDLSTS